MTKHCDVLILQMNSEKKPGLALQFPLFKVVLNRYDKIFL